MLIRKSFNIKNTHVVRNCSSERCKKNLHSHTYEIEVFFKADALDNGMMVLDFGLLKRELKQIIKAFHNSYSFWTKESDDFKKNIKNSTDRWIEMPVSPSAEAYSLMFTKIFTEVINNTEFNNGEQNITLYSVRVHETRTGYAESFQEDINSSKMPNFTLKDIKFSEGTNISKIWNSLLNKEKFINPIVTQQV